MNLFMNKALLFRYDEAFERNIGIVSEKEQKIIRKSRVAVAGLGGIGGICAEGLMRLGIDNITIADGDEFDLINFNRQAGASVSSVGTSKVYTMRDRMLDINPEADIRTINTFLTEDNIDEFLEHADIVLDAIDAFCPCAHRLLHRKAREQGKPVIFAAPLGFSCAVLVFSPEGMDADTYFDWRDGQSETEQVLHLAMGTAPKGLHIKVMDTRYVDIENRLAPSNTAACMLCAGVVVNTVTKLLLGRGKIRFVPYYMQFDPYILKFRQGRLRRGMRGLWQRIKKQILLRMLRKGRMLRVENRCQKTDVRKERALL